MFFFPFSSMSDLLSPFFFFFFLTRPPLLSSFSQLVFIMNTKWWNRLSLIETITIWYYNFTFLFHLLVTFCRHERSLKLHGGRLFSLSPTPTSSSSSHATMCSRFGSCTSRTYQRQSSSNGEFYTLTNL